MSLRLRLVSIIGLSLVLLWSLVALWMFTGVQRELRLALDDRLAASAHMVAGLVARLPPQQLRSDDATAAPALDVVARDGVACEVSMMHGEVAIQTLARTSASPRLDQAPPGYATRIVNGHAWRIFVLRQGALRVATADRIDVRESLLRGIVLAAALPFAVAITGGLLLLWFGVGGGLRPLENIRRALAARRPDAVEPLPALELPWELQPLVDTIRRLLTRVQDAIARERRFTDDAAHELRTPLTAIKTHLQVLRLSCKGRPMAQATAQALANAEAGVLRLQHTADQLLLLARLGRQEPETAVQVDALHAARLAIADALAGNPSARAARAPRVELQAPAAPALLSVPEPLLISALRNLLDNALQHTAEATSVVLQIEQADQRVEFAVLDEGPGMTPAELLQAPQRFWRRSGGTSGSGLGLSIVEAIARQYGGELRLERRNPRGLQASLSFPAHGRAEAEVGPVQFRPPAMAEASVPPARG